MNTLDPTDDLLRAGYLTAAMNRPLDPDAPPAFVRGYRNYRDTDGTECCADASVDVDRITGLMRAHGFAPDRRVAAEPEGYALAHVLGWSLVAFVAGLAAPGVVAGLAATFGASS